MEIMSMNIIENMNSETNSKNIGVEEPERDVIDWLRCLVWHNTGRGQATISQVLVKNTGTSWKYAYFEEAGRREATWGFGDVTLGKEYDDEDIDYAHSVDELMELYPAVDMKRVENCPDVQDATQKVLRLKKMARENNLFESEELYEDDEFYAEEFKNEMTGKAILLASRFIDVTNRVIIA